ncbi:MAG: GNAT family N-acetyltransferase [Ignavibacteriales bacterium CG18_big_fil_WC_8_21_14_2_50_31_20]|nr:MAG: GNAT family N-acetyltransferase [Ignavibacteriales bacterium CG18_big_fil_WC_8_21_14_2_50_31_20]
MKNLENLQFQKLDFEGLQTLVKWAEDEGWNPGPNDAEIYWATDPDGYYGYFHNDELIAGGSIVSYNKQFGFMGFFIVKPEYRSLGIGRKLWYQRRDTLLSRLNDDASVGMDGVIAMQTFYKKGGFEIAFRDERHEKIGEEFIIDQNISPIIKDDFDSILEYDKQCFGFSRPQFLIPWLKQPDVKTFKYSNNGKLEGFAIIRKANKGYKICPLFADNSTIAEELYKACLNSVVGKPLYLDIPVINSDAVALTQKYNTTYVFECARMYYGKAPNIEINKVFGITTFELG